MASSGAWTGDGTYTAKICFYQTPFIITIRLKFSGQEVLFDSEANVSFGQAKEPPLRGRSE